MNSITANDILAEESNLLGQRRNHLVAEGAPTAQSALYESVGIEQPNKAVDRFREQLNEAGVTLNSFKKAMKDGDEKAMRAGAKEYVAKGVMSANEVYKMAHSIDSKMTRKKWDKIVESTELDEATNIGAAVLKKFKKGDKIRIEAKWLKKPRILTVMGTVTENTSESDGSKWLHIAVASGSVRPGHVAGGGVMYNYWGDGELTYQPTLQQQLKKIDRIAKAKTEDIEPDGPAMIENIANFGNKRAKGFTSKDNDGKPGIDPEHRKDGAKGDGKGKKKEFGGKQYFKGKPKKEDIDALALSELLGES